MRVGPVEVLICTFPSPEIDQSVAYSLNEAVESGAVALLDVVTLARDPQGILSVRDLGDDLPDAWTRLVVDPRPITLLSETDIAVAAASVKENESAVLVTLEHRWARRLTEDVRNSGGATVLHVRIPHETVVEAFQADGVAAS